MQPNSPNKPVMDVTPAGNQAASTQGQSEPKPEVHNSPEQINQPHTAEHQNAAPEQAPTTEQSSPKPEDQEKTDEPQQQPTKPKPAVPASVITAAVFIMLGLIGLAVLAYLTSQ